MLASGRGLLATGERVRPPGLPSRLVLCSPTAFPPPHCGSMLSLLPSLWETLKGLSVLGSQIPRLHSRRVPLPKLPSPLAPLPWFTLPHLLSHTFTA